MTVNQAIKVDKYPLQLIEDIFASLGGSTMFSKVDLRHAYLQMELEEQAKELCTRKMELILQGIPKTQCLLDDIIVAGSSEEEHFHILEQVLERLERHNLAINMDKSTHCHGNADALSRLPLTEATEVERQDREELDDCPEFRLNQLEQIPVTTAVLRDATAMQGSCVIEGVRVYPICQNERLKAQQVKSIPSATNGLAERFVQSLKQALRASKKEKKLLSHRVSSFLIQYRNARHPTLDTTPAQMMIKKGPKMSATLAQA
eukprot:Em0024g301a